MFLFGGCRRVMGFAQGVDIEFVGDNVGKSVQGLVWDHGLSVGVSLGACTWKSVGGAFGHVMINK